MAADGEAGRGFPTDFPEVGSDNGKVLKRLDKFCFR